MSSTTVMKAKARLIKEETQEGANTAARVGGLFEDIVDYLDSADVTSSLDITPYVTTGTRIAKFKVNGEETTIFAPSNGGSGGGGGSSYDDTEIREILNELDRALDNTTALANSEKERLNGVIADIDNNVKAKMEDAVNFADWIQGNFPEGETTFQSGWNDKTKEYLQVVGLWDTNETTTNTKWSYIRQHYDEIQSAVVALSEGESLTELLETKVAQGIHDGKITIDLETVYAVQEAETIVEWLYSALRNNTSSGTDETCVEIVSAGKNSFNSAIADIRTYVRKLENNEYLAVANVEAKVGEAITGLYSEATAGYSETSIFAQAKQSKNDIAAIVVGMTGDSSTVNLATRLGNWKAGVVIKSDLTTSVASLIAANSDNTAAAAIINTVNDYGSSVKISANRIEFEGQTIAATVSGGLAINNGKQGGMGQYSYLITANDNDGLVIDSRGGNADISIFNIDKYGNISHTYNNVTRFEFNREGDGFIACGNIAWTADGDVVIKSSKEFIDEIGTPVIDEITLEFDETYGFSIKQGDGESVSNRFSVTPSGKLIQMANGVTTFQIEADGSGLLGKPYGNRAATYTPITWTPTSVSLLGTFTTTYNASNLRSTSVNGELLCSGSFEVNSGKAILDSDGSGQLANGAIVWDTDGTLTVDGYETYSLPDNTNLDGFLFHSGSLTAYTIRNGLIVKKTS